MVNEFNLSERFNCDCNCCSRRKEYVKEFIKRLKEFDFEDLEIVVKKHIDKLAGGDLI